MNIVNTLSQDVTILSPNGDVLNFYPKEGVKVGQKLTVIATKTLPDGTPTGNAMFGPLNGLPEENADTMYIVSALVMRELLPERRDLLTLGEAIRQNGTTIGFQSLWRTI
jgi:hypothetical protein